MVTVSGKIQRNINHFYELLTTGAIEPRCRTTEFEGHVVCLLPDNSAWMFTKTELNIGKSKYIQLTTADVTERWRLTEQLRRQNDQLKHRSEELNDAIANLHVLSHEREIQKAKMRAHDILGERLTLLLRVVRSEQTLDYNLLRSVSQGLINELVSGQSLPSPQDELDGLQQTFGAFGVKIMLDGKLPEDDAKGRLFVDIIREGVTNAIRHGFATHISV
jgi:nitrate/nitrite-specific signal transduction histidine kinase